MNGRVVTCVIVLAVVALVAAMWWDPDEHRDVLPSAVTPEEVAAPGDSAPHDTAAEAARRNAVDVAVAPATDAATTVPLAFIGRVEDVDGHPIEGARVDLSTSTPEHPTETMTHADGSFSLPATTSTPRALEFAAPAYVDAVSNNVFPGEFVTVRLERGTELRGQVVERGTRVPIANAEVAREDVGRGEGAIVRADARGVFAIVVPRLPAVIVARKTGFGTGRAVVASQVAVEVELPRIEGGAFAWFHVFDRDTNAPIDGAMVNPGPTERVEPGFIRAHVSDGYAGTRSAWFSANDYLTRSWQSGDQTGVDREHAIDVAMTPASSIAGVLVDAQHAGIAGASIVVRPSSTFARGEFGASKFYESHATTDADGRFVVECVPITEPLKWCATLAGAIVAEREPIEAAIRGRLDLGVIEVEPAFALEVIVTRGANGPRVPGASVRAFGDAWVRSATTDAQGIATFARPDRFRFVSAQAPGNAPAWASVDLQDRRGTILVALKPASHLSGTVRDSAGAPLAGAKVGARYMTRDPEHDVHDRLVNSLSDVSLDPGHHFATTGADGRFAFGDLAEGEYSLSAMHPDASPYAIGAPNERPRTFHTGRDDVNLVVASTAVLVVHVTDSLTHAACDSMEMTIDAGGGGWKSMHQDTNGFVTSEVVAGAAVSVDVTGPGHIRRIGEFPKLAPGEVRVVEVALDPEARVSGHITYADGVPAASAGVALRSVDEIDESSFASADANGAYELSGLGAGEYLVMIAFMPRPDGKDWDDWTPEPTTVTLRVGERRTLDLVLKRSK